MLGGEGGDPGGNVVNGGAGPGAWHGSEWAWPLSADGRRTRGCSWSPARSPEERGGGGEIGHALDDLVLAVAAADLWELVVDLSWDPADLWAKVAALPSDPSDPLATAAPASDPFPWEMGACCSCLVEMGPRGGPGSETPGLARALRGR